MTKIVMNRNTVTRTGIMAAKIKKKKEIAQEDAVVSLKDVMVVEYQNLAVYQTLTVIALTIASLVTLSATMVMTMVVIMIIMSMQELRATLFIFPALKTHLFRIFQTQDSVPTKSTVAALAKKNAIMLAQKQTKSEDSRLMVISVCSNLFALRNLLMAKKNLSERAKKNISTAQIMMITIMNATMTMILATN